MLERAIVDGKLEPDFEILRRLGDLLLVSREKARAISALQRAAAVAPDGKTHELLANVWFNDQEWRNAHDAYVSAIGKGGVDNVGRAVKPLSRAEDLALEAVSDHEVIANGDCVHDLYLKCKRCDDKYRRLPPQPSA